MKLNKPNGSICVKRKLFIGVFVQFCLSWI